MSKDTAARAFFPGYLVPGALGVLILFNVLTRTVYWPTRGGSRRGFTTHTQTSVVLGTILLKLGLAAGLYAWYVLANDDKRERFATPILFGSVVVAAVGVVIAAVGAF